jgi:hypothetical protein
MKLQTIFTVLFFILAVIFAWLYIQQQPAAANWQALTENSDAYRAASEKDKEDFRSLLHTNAFSIQDTSLPFQDERLAKRYIKEFDGDTIKIDQLFRGNGMEQITRKIWVDRNTVADIARILAKYSNYDGIRLYLAKYPTYTVVQDPQRGVHLGNPSSYDHKLTVVVVTTKAGATAGQHVDSYKDATGALEGLYNYHDICPPTCPTGTSTLEQP